MKALFKFLLIRVLRLKTRHFLTTHRRDANICISAEHDEVSKLSALSLLRIPGRLWSVQHGTRACGSMHERGTVVTCLQLGFFKLCSIKTSECPAAKATSEDCKASEYQAGRQCVGRWKQCAGIGFPSWQIKSNIKSHGDIAFKNTSLLCFVT